MGKKLISLVPEVIVVGRILGRDQDSGYKSSSVLIGRPIGGHRPLFQNLRIHISGLPAASSP
jgi:hypothetical protein